MAVSNIHDKSICRDSLRPGYAMAAIVRCLLYLCRVGPEPPHGPLLDPRSRQ